MSIPSALGADSFWLGFVAEPAARALVLAGAVWLLLAAFRVREVSIRLAVWTAVLYAALAMPLLSRVVPEVPLPLLSPQTTQMSAARIASQNAATGGPAARFAVFHPATVAAAGARNAATSELVAMNTGIRAAGISWPAVAIFVYWLVAAIFLARFVLGWISARRLIRTSAPIVDGQAQRLLAREARKAGLKKSPPLAESAALSVPATLGLLRPAVILPAEWIAWNQTQMSAVLAHELSHVARRDGRTRALSRLHRAFFWFSPLSWWLDGALAELAEQASDDAALRSGADRIRYAEVLLHFFRALRSARARVRWEGVAMAQGSRSERRVERILHGSVLSRGLGLAAMAVLMLVAVPLVCLTASVHISHAVPVSLPPSAAPPAPPALASVPTAVPAADSAKVLPAAAQIPVDAVQGGTARNGNGVGCGADESFAVVSGRSVISECASPSDLQRVWELRGRIRGRFLWIRKDGRRYVIHDRSVVNAALDAFAPLEAIARERAILDVEENELVRAQMELDMRQMAMVLEARNFWPQLPALDARLDAIESAPAADDLSRAQAEWNAMRNSMVRMELIAGENFEMTSREQAALDREQAALDRLQTELEKRQAELAGEAVGFSYTLIDRSLLQGLARSL